MLYGGNNGSGNGNGYSSHHAPQQSYDAATTVSGSTNGYGTGPGTEPYAHSTDPSSENSSVDRIPQPGKPDLAETYGLNGFGGAPEFQGPILEELGHDAPAYGQPGYGQGRPVLQGQNSSRYPQSSIGRAGGYPQQDHELPPPPPPHKQNGAPPRDPVRLQSTNAQSSYESSPPERVDSGEKRKSWLKRRFSKKI